MTSSEDAYRAFRAMLRRYIAQRLRQPEDVDDVLQDVFLRVTRNSAALASARSPEAWLRAVAKSAIIDHLRKLRTQAEVQAVITREAGAAPRRSDPLDAAGNDAPEAMAACLAPLLQTLSPPYAAALRAVDLDGERQSDVAARTGLSVSTVKSRVQRARRQLRSAILACCQVDRDGAGKVVGLSRSGEGAACC